jgi:hypothetical protein
MTEETDGTIAGTEAEAIAEAPQAETPSDNATEQQTEADETGQADESSEPTKRKPWWEKRFDELTAKRYDAERQADYWRGLAEGRNQTPVQQQQVEVPDRWEDPEGYDKWLIKQAATTVREELSTEAKARSYQERENAFRASKPDYDSIARDPSLPVSQMMAQVIWDSEKGPELLYHLGQNRSEAERIRALPDHLQAKELGYIEAALRAPAPTQNRAAPPSPPPKTVSGISAGIAKTPDEMSMAEYAAWVKERDKT